MLSCAARYDAGNRSHKWINCAWSETEQSHALSMRIMHETERIQNDRKKGKTSECAHVMPCRSMHETERTLCESIHDIRKFSKIPKGTCRFKRIRSTQTCNNLFVCDRDNLCRTMYLFVYHPIYICDIMLRVPQNRCFTANVITQDTRESTLDDH